MIRSFKDRATRKVFLRQHSPRLPADVQRRAQIKLQLIHAATSVNDLRVPPGNRLEALTGNRAGQYSIRINRQWRICFVWDGEDAHDVEIVDYH